MITLSALADLAAAHPADLEHRVGPLLIGSRSFDVDARPVIMGTVNLSRDSTYRESVAVSHESAVRKARVMAAEDADIVAQIKELIETRVRPAVANDGGDIVYRGFREGVVYLTMQGACSGCPSSTATLRHGIENLLRHFIPEVQEVRPV